MEGARKEIWEERIFCYLLKTSKRIRYLLLFIKGKNLLY